MGFEREQSRSKLTLLEQVFQYNEPKIKVQLGPVPAISLFEV